MITIALIVLGTYLGGFSVYHVIKAEKGFLLSIKVFFNW